MIAPQHGLWVLVADGRKALFLANEGDATQPKFEIRKVLSHDDPPSRALGTDAPGRSFSRAGPGRSAIEAADLHALSEARFLKDVATKLNHAAAVGLARHIVIVAPARALAVLRGALEAAARAIVVAEFDKELVNFPAPEIQAHVLKMLAA